MTSLFVAPASRRGRGVSSAAPSSFARPLRLTALGLLGLALAPVACGKKPPPVDPSPPPAVSAEAAPVTVSSAPSPPPGPEPPSGQWSVKADVVADTCPVKHGAPPPATVALVSKLSKGKTHLNLALPAAVVGNAAAKPAPTVRQDLQGEVGHSFRDTLPPRDLDCPSYEVSYTLKVLEVSRERIRVSKLEEYGDGKKCAKKPNLSSCKVELSYTYTLAKAECEAACNASMANATAPGTEGAPMLCDCS
ncbi:MAG: hypothetical protein MUF34_19975 [Polyangiaceae bacterium]|nr:hypothetical protein [Polyangiaceae bacterium]